MDPRLRAAVDSSLAFYDDVLALHGIPTSLERGVWAALGAPRPDGWSVIRDAALLVEWSARHDYTGVLPDEVLDHPRFTVPGRTDDRACPDHYRGPMAYDVQKTDDEWRAELTPEEYAVLRKAGTERAFKGEYTDTETVGVYRCKACRARLFESDTKFHSGCGWPSFYQPISDTIEYIEDSTLGMKRVEVRCANCGSHLGHVFPDGYGTPTGDRYCINSISLTLEPAEEPARQAD